MIHGEKLWPKNIIQDMEYREFESQRYYTYQNAPKSVYHTLIETTKRTPEKIAFIDNEQREFMYIEIWNMVNQYANYLQDNYQIQKGSNVGIIAHANISFCITFYAISKIGAVFIPLPTKYKKEELLSLVYKSDIDLLLMEENYLEWFQEISNPILVIKEDYKKYGLEYLPLSSYNNNDITMHEEETSDAVIMYTSGTTAAAKGVVLTNYNIIHAIVSYQRTLGVTKEDSTVIAVPIYHITGLIGLLGLFVYVGGTVHLHKRYDEERILSCILEQDITFMHGSPTVFSKLLKCKDRYPFLPSLRIIGCGSSYIPIDKMNAIHKWLPQTKFQVIYGMTETASPALLCPYDSPTSIYAEAAGIPVPGLQVKIINEQFQECKVEEIGTLWIKGTNVTPRYYNHVSEDSFDVGWLNTGDNAYYNEDNYIFIVGRNKDMINRGGEKIWSRDVEEAILSHPEIEDCAVVGIPDVEYGEAVGAIVVKQLKSEITKEQIQQYLYNKIARFKVPTHILFIQEVYKTKGWKVDKKRIQEYILRKEWNNES